MKLEELKKDEYYVVTEDIPMSYCTLILGISRRVIEKGTILRCKYVYKKGAHFSLGEHPNKDVVSNYAEYDIRYAKRIRPLRYPKSSLKNIKDLFS